MRDSVPIISIRDCLLVSIQAELGDALAREVQDALMTRASEEGCKGVVLDISSVQLIDTYITRVLSDIGRSVRFMGAACVVVGMRPAVAMTLVEMGMDMSGVDTALSLESALERLELLR
jgi:rsbT antagonist protein RsbS